ncbi:MAG TPA: hypothetical protein VIV60_10295, partial [Polyangiaceae bacterium]
MVPPKLAPTDALLVTWVPVAGLPPLTATVELLTEPPAVDRFEELAPLDVPPLFDPPTPTVAVFVLVLVDELPVPPTTEEPPLLLLVPPL